MTLEQLIISDILQRRPLTAIRVINKEVTPTPVFLQSKTELMRAVLSVLLCRVIDCGEGDDADKLNVKLSLCEK
jgi:hypothetical protein